MDDRPVFTLTVPLGVGVYQKESISERIKLIMLRLFRVQ
jgi:hypothetical protein